MSRLGPALSGLGNVRQIAYVVSDLRAAASRHAQLFGSGPFFVAEGLTLDEHLYRGRPWTVDIDAALGQWGDVQLELIQPNDARPSLFRELLPAGTSTPRCHHLCFQPEDIEASIAAFAAAGHPVVFELALHDGTKDVMVDTAKELGHFVQLYERTPEVDHFYEYIRTAAEEFDGDGALFRSLNEVNGEQWA